MSTFLDRSQVNAVHEVVLGLFQAAYQVVEDAACPTKLAWPHEEQTLKALYENLCDYFFCAGRADRNAIETWIEVNRRVRPKTALEKMVVFAMRVKDAVWNELAGEPQPIFRIPGTGLRAKELEALRSGSTTRRKRLAAVPLPNRDRLERRLEDELLTMRTFGTLDEATRATVLLQPIRKPTSGRGDDAPETANKTEQTKGASIVQKAVAIILAHPGWSAERIAKEVGCRRSTLYRHPIVKAALVSRHGDRRQLPRGHRKDDGTVEAYAQDDQADLDD